MLTNYLNGKKLTASLSFSTFKVDSWESNVSQWDVFNKHRSTINAGLPTMIGYTINGAQPHIMLGVGYTSDGYYICRDTWTEDGRPFAAFLSGAYNVSWTGYKYYVIGATYSNSSSSTAWGAVTLRYGDSNFNVKRLKYFLKALYYEPGTINNTFDTACMNAVKAFQSDYGLTADGIVGSNTYSKMITAHIMRYDNRTANYRLLKYGKKGDDVAQLQFRLKNRGYYSGTIDGVFGSGTKTAVINFQQANGLTPDGLAGTATMKKLTY